MTDAATYTVAMPSNMEAEQALLGAILTNNDAMHHVGGQLTPEHFYAGVHQKIFAEILKGVGQGQRVTPVTLKGQIVDFGEEPAYLAKLAAKAVSFVNVHDYARIIQELALRRELMGAAISVLSDAEHASSGDMATLLATAVDKTSREIMGSSLHDSRAVSISVVEGMKNVVHRTPTGLKRLDRALNGGLMRGQCYGFAARRGEGKTMLSGTISHNLNHAGVRHLFIPIEMGEQEIQKRSLARAMGQPTSIFEDDPQGEFYTEIAHTATLDPGNVIYHDNAFLTFDSLKRVIATGVSKHKIEGFILDYWQLVAGKPPKESKAAFLAEVAQWIAAACKEYDIWAIVLAQLNRDGEIRESDGLEMAASNIFHLVRPDPSLPGAYMEAKKARHSKFISVGSAESPSMEVHEHGSHFEELEFQSVLFSAVKGNDHGKPDDRGVGAAGAGKHKKAHGN